VCTTQKGTRLFFSLQTNEIIYSSECRTNVKQKEEQVKRAVPGVTKYLAALSVVNPTLNSLETGLLTVDSKLPF
jgi:hypothetical protein